MRKRFFLVTFVVSVIFFVAHFAQAATIYSNSSTGNDLTGDGSLGNPYKTFHKAYTVAITGDTIDLTGTFDWSNADETGDAVSSGYTIAKNLTIQGQNATDTIIQASSTPYTADRNIFTISSGRSVTIQDVTIRHGYSAGGSTAIQASSANLTILRSIITLNRSTLTYQGSGQTIYHSGASYKFIMRNSTVSENGNMAGYNNYTGGIYIGDINAENEITNCTFYHNSGSYNGAMYVRGSVTVTNSTFVANRGTVSGNDIHSFAEGRVYVKNSIFADSAGVSNLVAQSGGIIYDGGYNIVETQSGTSFVNGVNGNLVGNQVNLNIAGSLALNDTVTGVTTLALSAGSVAIDAGDPTDTAHNGISIPVTDERTFYRNGPTDIGAFEYGGFYEYSRPDSQASSIVSSSVSYSSMNLSWTNGNGGKRVVFIKQGNSGTTTPIDNTVYTANSVFGSGTSIGSEDDIWYAVYNGTGSNVTVTGLTPAKEYIIQVFEYNGSGSYALYKNETATDNPIQEETINLSTPANQATSISFSSVSYNQMTINWTNGSGDARVAFIKQASSGTTTPENNISYTANAIFGSGTQIGSTGWYAIYKGTGSSVTVTGLSALTNYRVQIFEYNGGTGSELYLTSNSTDNPKTQKTTTTPNINVFTYTGSLQSFIVPSGVEEIIIKVWGAGGGGGHKLTAYSGGAGGYASGNLNVTPGQEIFVIVGGGGAGARTSAGLNTGGYGGGGNSCTSSYIHGGGAGGGYSGIFNSSNIIQGNALLIAGGGGGGRTYSGSSSGGGGGTTGGGATNYGGTQLSAGTSGSALGSALQGGTKSSCAGSDAADGPGGGGGYFGGSGTTNSDGGGSGGGSGYIHSSVTNSELLQGATSTSSPAVAPPKISDLDYTGSAGYSGAGSDTVAGVNGNNGLVVISFSSIATSTYNLVFQNHDAAVIESTEYEEGADLTSHTLPTDPVRVGYTFTGWDISVPETMPAEDVVITATYTVADPDAPILSSIVVYTSPEGAIINWNTDESASALVNYGLTSSCTATTSETDTSPRDIGHSGTISGLVSCTRYYYKLQSTDGNSNTGYSSIGTFKTTGCTGDSTVTATGQGTATAVSGGTVLQGNIALTIPLSFKDSVESAIFQANKLDSTSFLVEAGTPSGLNQVGTDIYTLKALVNENTPISSFDSAISITMNYSDSDIVGVDESSLWIYRYDGSDWHALNNCAVNQNLNTVTCQTTAFSDFGLFGEEVEEEEEPEMTSSRGNGTTVEGRIKNLLAIGKIREAEELQKQYSKSITINIASTTITNQMATTSKFIFTQTLRPKMINSEVKELQKFLNRNGYILTLSGPGSPGQETEYFGTLTQLTLIKFQEANFDLILKPLNLAKGTGIFGEVTRAFVNNLLKQ